MAAVPRFRSGLSKYNKKGLVILFECQRSVSNQFERHGIGEMQANAAQRLMPINVGVHRHGGREERVAGRLARLDDCGRPL